MLMPAGYCRPAQRPHEEWGDGVAQLSSQPSLLLPLPPPQVSVKYANTAFGVPLGVAGGARDGVIDLLIQENLLYGRTITRWGVLAMGEQGCVVEHGGWVGVGWDYLLPFSGK